VLVKTLVNSGISAPAAVPQEMMTERTHQRFAWPEASLISPSISLLMANVTRIERAEVIQTSQVSGFSGLKSLAVLYFEVNKPSVMK
jgi:hypothetical protein